MHRRDLLFFVGGLTALPTFRQQPPTIDSAGLKTLLNTLRTRNGVPALGAILVDRQSVIAHAVCGTRKAGEDLPVSPDCHWQLGSISKTFTGTLAAKLVESGKMTWDTNLAAVFPQWAGKMAEGVGRVTVRQMVLHRSGMQRGDVVGWGGNAETNAPGLTLTERRARFAALAVAHPLQSAPGSRRTYSNLAYNTLGHVLEAVSGVSWEGLVQQEIAGPLGIRPVFGEPSAGTPDTEPWPHLASGEKWRAVPGVGPTQWGYHICNPAGGVSLTLADFGRWMQAHLNGEQRGGILSAGSFRNLHAPERDGGVSPFGMLPEVSGTGRRIGHNGSNGRNYANHYLLLDRGIGVLFVTNCTPRSGTLTNSAIDNALLAEALPNRWPRPALSPPEPVSNQIEGEGLEVAKVTGGNVVFQPFSQLSRGFQLAWFDAKEGNQLTLRGRVARAGRYAVEMVCCGNTDYGAATVAVGSLSRRVDFKLSNLRWETVPLGETVLPAGPFDVVVTAHGNSGENGVKAHLGLDVLRLRWLGE